MIEGAEISNNLSLGVFLDESKDNFFLFRSEEPVLKFGEIEVRAHGRSVVNLFLQEFKNSGKIGFGHSTEADTMRSIKGKRALQGFHGLVEAFELRRNTAETNVDELFRVEVTVEVAGGGDGGGNVAASSVDGLPNVSQVDTTSDFLDEDGSEALITKALGDTEEVNFTDTHGLFTDLDVARNTRNEGEDFLGFLLANTNVPVLVVAGRSEGPLQEGAGVVEAEHGVIILNVVFVQEMIDLVKFVGVGDIRGEPFEDGSDGVRFLGDISDSFGFEGSTVEVFGSELATSLFEFVSSGGSLRNWLSLPEFMFLIVDGSTRSNRLGRHLFYFILNCCL